MPRPREELSEGVGHAFIPVKKTMFEFMPNKPMVDVVYMRRLSALITEIACKMVAAILTDMVWVFAHSCKLRAYSDLAKFRP